MQHPKVSIIVPTYNNYWLMRDMLTSLQQQTYTHFHVIINDDKRSIDDLEAKAKADFPDLDITVIHENQAVGQARFAGAKHAKTKYIVHLDADFQLTPMVIEECVNLCETTEITGIIIPEEIIGEGYWTRCRWLEKQMYNGDDTVECARFFLREHYEAIGGYDPQLEASEDKDLDLRFRAAGYQVGRIPSLIYHNERRQTLRGTMRKKFFWGQKFSAFIAKQSKHSAKQSNVLFRAAYFRNWRLILRYPHLFMGMWIMKSAELLAVICSIVYVKLTGRKISYRN